MTSTRRQGALLRARRRMGISLATDCGPRTARVTCFNPLSESAIMSRGSRGTGTHIHHPALVATAEISKAAATFRDCIADPARQSLSGGIPQRVEFKIGRGPVVTGFKALHPWFK